MNAHRGEGSIELGGRTLLLRPTFAALASLEERSGEALLALSERVISGRLTLRDCVNLLRSGIEGAGETVPDDLEQLVVDEGYLKVTASVISWFRTALVGDPEQKGDRKANPTEAKSV